MFAEPRFDCCTSAEPIVGDPSRVTQKLIVLSVDFGCGILHHLQGPLLLFNDKLENAKSKQQYMSTNHPRILSAVVSTTCF